MTQPSLRMLQPAGRQNRRQPHIWYALLAGMLAAGGLLALAKPWGSLAPSGVYAALAAVIGWGCCFAASLAQSASKPLAWTLRLVPWFALGLFFGAGGALEGTKLWINCIITSWNALHDGGIALFRTAATHRDVCAAACFAGLCGGQLAWVVTNRRILAMAAGLSLIPLLTELLSGVFSPLGSALYLSGMLGLWVSMPKRRPSAQALCLFGLCTVILCTCAFLFPTQELTAVSQLRDRTKQKVHTVRYGEDLLPEGNLYHAGMLNRGTSELLRVTTQQNKTMYLRAFVGARYENGVWQPLPDSAYGGEFSGMLRWLEQQNFEPLTQAAAYYALTDAQDTPQLNNLTVQITSASRYYLYTPITAQKIGPDAPAIQKDTRFLPRGLSGMNLYTVQEYSSILPSELTVAASWVTEPQTQAQRQYIEAEAVYREFVYDTYTDVDEQLKPQLQELFWQDYAPEHESVYGAVCRVRDKLSKMTRYVRGGASVPEDADPITWFLSGSGQANAMFYASTAVQALRSHGLAARYVEGYYVSAAAAQGGKGTISLTGQNAHAWIEVYFDGIGWLPVDMTPGYYYDALTLQQMVAMPDPDRKTAALDDGGSGADEVVDVPEAGGQAAEEQLPEESARSYVVLGIFAALLMLYTLMACGLELIRLLLLLREKAIYRRASAQRKAKLLQEKIFSVLALRGFDACLGWNAEKLDAALSADVPGIAAGEYCRAARRLEKAVYGDEPLEQYELRALESFLDKLMQRGQIDWMYLKLRYACLYRALQPADGQPQ